MSEFIDICEACHEKMIPIKKEENRRYFCDKCNDHFWICDICNQRHSPIIRVIKIATQTEVSLCSSCDKKNDTLPESEQKYKSKPIVPLLCKKCGQKINNNAVDLPIIDEEGHHIMPFHYCLPCRLLWYDFDHCWFGMDDEDYRIILSKNNHIDNKKET